MMEERHLYWTAGLIEGEGTFALVSGSLRLQVTSVDKDVLDRAQRVTGMGNIHGPYSQPKGSGWTDYYVWSVTTSRDTYGLLMMVWPLLGERRKGQVEKVVRAWLAKPLAGRYKTHCKRGHEFTKENTRMDDNGQGAKQRTCRTCARERQHAYRERKKLELMRESI